MATLTLPHLGVANAQFVTPTLLIGGDLDLRRAVDELEDLVGAGLTHVIDVRVEWNDATFVAAHAPQVAYLHHGVDDAGQRIPAAWFETGVQWAGEAIAGGSVVLTHCHMGINRGPSMGFAVLLALGWDPIDALTAIRAARPIANVAYADDALTWWHRRNGNGAALRRDKERLRQWRDANHFDVRTVIRKLRAQEYAT